MILHSGSDFQNSDPKIHFWAYLGQKKSKLLVLAVNRFTWYLGGADSASGDRFSKFRPQNPLLGIFGPKKSKLPDFFKNCHTEYLNDLILIPKLVFRISNPKSIFRQIWDKKVKAVCFVWKLAHTQYFKDADAYFDISFLKFQNQVSMMLILILKLIFWNSKPKSIFLGKFELRRLNC